VDVRHSPMARGLPTERSLASSPFNNSGIGALPPSSLWLTFLDGVESPHVERGCRLLLVVHSLCLVGPFLLRSSLHNVNSNLKLKTAIKLINSLS